MARKRKKADGGGSPGWMTTYGDLMSLLLTFFILLFSMSMVNVERFEQAAQSLRISFSGTESGETILDVSGNILEDSPLETASESVDFENLNPEDLTVVEEAALAEHTVPEEVHELYSTVEGFLEEEGIDSEVSISRDQEGVYIDIQEAILFDSGSATLKSHGRETIGTMAGLFQLFDNEIIVEGYTDDVPAGSAQFASNWELSVARAVSVLRYLSEEHGIQPERLSARGYGEYRPLVPNDSPENKAQNRRVNIVIVHDERKEVKNGSGN
ncbi:OmpA family protein [Alkalibacterium iburiense]|uniref:OmpA family protein n=1 Tax=Alkalibacterium iburiense TaxID=290589 RepID=A0ABN0XEE9_9LACT